MARLTLHQLAKTFPGGVRAVDGLSLDVADGEMLVLVGPSGCGKTTTLRLIAGLERPTAGSVSIDGRGVDHLPPRARDVAMVFQNHALYPHMTVRRNLGFGLKLRGAPKAEIERRVAETAAMLEIEDLLDRRPGALSGGQQQRVALGRAMVRRPKVFLLDEPLASLDAALRARMRVELRRLHQRLGATMIHVTHDQTEAMTMARRAAVVHQGRILQVDDPEILYRRPANRRVAETIGSPPMNLLDGRLESRQRRLVFCQDRFELDVHRGWAARLGAHVGKALTLGVRAEHLVATAGAGRRQATVEAPVRATVEVIEPLGAQSHLHLNIGRQVIVARIDPRQDFRPGQPVDLAIAPADLHFFDAATGNAVE